MGKAFEIIRFIYTHRIYNFLSVFVVCALFVVSFLTKPLIALYNVTMGVALVLALISFLHSMRNRSFKITTLLLFLILPIAFLLSSAIHGDFSKDTLHDVLKKIHWFYLAFVFCYIKVVSSYVERFFLLFLFLITFLLFLTQMLPYIHFMATSEQNVAFHDFNPQSWAHIEILHHLMSVMFSVGIVAGLWYISISNNNFFLRVFLFISIISLYIGIYLTGARVGMLGGILILCLFIGYHISKGNRWLMGLSAAMLVILLWASYIIYSKSEVIRYRINETKKEITYLFNTDYDLQSMEVQGNFTVRVMGTLYYKDLLKEKLLWGITGPSEKKYLDALNKYRYEHPLSGWMYDLYPANQWFKYTGQIGLPLTFIVFLCLFSALLIEGKKSKILLTAYYSVIFLFSQTEASFDHTTTFYWLTTITPFIIRVSNTAWQQPTNNTIN